MKVLIADDEPVIRRLILRVLTSRGHDCRAVSEADELERAARLDPPDAVISDINLGGSDGIEVCRRLKDSRPSLRVLMITGDPEESRRARSVGLHAVLDKPFTMDELASAAATMEAP